MSLKHHKRISPRRINKVISILTLGSSRRTEQDTLHTLERIKNQLDMVRAEKSQLERMRLSLSEQIDQLTVENQKLQAANTEAQRQRDVLEDEKEDVTKDKQRISKENDRW